MNLTTQRRSIYGAAAGLVAVAGMGMIWSVSSIEGNETLADPLAIRSPRAAESPDQQPTTTSDATAKIDFAVPLQQTLVDVVKRPPKPAPRKVVPPPPPRKVTPPPVKKPRLDWTLVGTVIDGDQSIAIFSDSSGKTDVRRVGETVELSPSGVVVRQIDSDEVTLEMRGGESKLTLTRSFKSNGGNGRAARRRGR